MFYGLDLEELQNYRERVNAITPEDIQRVAQQYLHPDRLSIVLVGDGSMFAKDLAAAGFDQVERIPLASTRSRCARTCGARALRRAPRLMPASWNPPGSRTRRPGDPAAPGPSQSRAHRPAVNAKGGLALLRGIKTVKSDVSDDVRDSAGGPARLRHDLCAVSRRSSGWMRAGRRVCVVQTFDNGTVWCRTTAAPGMRRRNSR